MTVEQDSADREEKAKTDRSTESGQAPTAREVSDDDRSPGTKHETGTTAPPLVVAFVEIGADDLALVGGKGANLGELASAGFSVPDGFCVTTHAFAAFLDGLDDADRDEMFERLAAVNPDDLDAARAVARAIRERLAGLPIPEAVASAVTGALHAVGADLPYAVRSSATAEDLPDASFAGQQDTFLNQRGSDAILDAIKRCWISLFTDRAILYRARNGFDHRAVRLSAVVQRMVDAEISGILFTADPLTGHRAIASIDASYGLGEALVSGTVSADLYRVDTRSDTIVEVRVGDKEIAVRTDAAGGTRVHDVGEDQRSRRVLDDRQAIELARTGRRIADHFGAPQDIEWAIDPGGQLHVLQSRPITALFPLPEPPPPPGDDALHVYLSVGHGQVMTDPMPKMARSVLRHALRLGSPAPGQPSPLIVEAGGRLYVDPTPFLRFAPMRHGLPRFLRVADVLMAEALAEVIERPSFLGNVSDARPRAHPWGVLRTLGPVAGRAFRRVLWARTADTVPQVEAWCDRYLENARLRIQRAAPGAQRVRVAREECERLLVDAVSRMFHIIASGMVARAALHGIMDGRVDPHRIDDVLRGLRGNVTTEMDLAVGDLAAEAARHPAVAKRLREVDDPLDGMEDVEGGRAFMGRWREFMERYGMRGAAEIDISRPRWREEPAALLRMVISRLDVVEGPGHHRAHFESMVGAGEKAVDALEDASSGGVFGAFRSSIVSRLGRVARDSLAAREHPKYLIIRVFGHVRQALLEAGEMLASDGRIEDSRDVWHLDFDELLAALEDRLDPRERIRDRAAAMGRYAALRPPRVMTSMGEAPEVRHGDPADLPEGALIGNSASSGVVEGTARVIQDPAKESLQPGEILVAPFTDPGWTPLFLNAAALVMEVGGLMTHGSVVAREYGIPAVVGVMEATARIADGQRIRVNGDRGWVELLDVEEPSALPDGGREVTDMDVAARGEGR